MHPTTPHGVRVITKRYFAIFAAFKELRESHAQVIQGHTFWRQSKASVGLKAANSSFRSIFNHFRDIAGSIRPDPEQLSK